MMEIDKHTFLISKTARYFTSGNLNEKTKNIWLVCHGYGQLAENFIRKFDVICDEENFIIAPEGLHRYYLDEKHTRVGASWMTREDRLDDIDDYIRMLDEILNRELPQSITNNHQPKIILLGFSQGVATASRWYRFGKVKPDVFIMWAGVFPPDLPLENELDIFASSRNFVVIGDQDEFFNAERKNHVFTEIRAKGIKFDILTFNDKHVIHTQTLLELKNRL